MKLMDRKTKEPLPEAVALRYDREREDAPRVVAKGRGVVAEQLLSIAKFHSVPVYQNQSVTQLLMAVALDREIPPELYQVVAKVLAHVYRMDAIAAKKSEGRR